MSTEERVLLVSAKEAGQRLDQLVAAGVKELSRTRVKQLILEGSITIDGAPVRAARRLREGELVTVTVPPPVSSEAAPTPQDLPLPILFEDSTIVVVDKPAGMAVHPAPGSPDGTVVNAILHHVSDLQGIGGELRPGIVHRLDKDTTGVLVIAKSETALRALQEDFKERVVKKLYLALVHGTPRLGEGTIDRSIARHPVDRKRNTSLGTLGRTGARSAITHYRVSESYQGASLIEARPETGRTHQIRVHLADLGHPLLGDETYGGARKDRSSPSLAVRRAALALGHHALHARTLTIHHPVTRTEMTFEAELPLEWRGALALLRAEGGSSPSR